MNNTNCLPEEDIQLLQQMIDILPPGEYELPQIIGESWKYIGSPATFSQLFRNTTRAGRLKGIYVSHVKSSNHTVYVIGAEKSENAAGRQTG